MKINFSFPDDPSMFTIFGYPGGELQVRLTEMAMLPVRDADQITINARITDTRSLIGLALLSDAIRGVNPGVVLRLNMPYFPYARADRRFVDGDCYGLKVFGDILHACRFHEVHTLDVHNQRVVWSDVSSFIRDHKPDQFIFEAMNDMLTRTNAQRPAYLLPDTGAAARYKRLEKTFSSVLPLVAQKQRDSVGGQLLAFSVPATVQYQDAILIVDDICDGGGTFLGIAKAIRAQSLKVPLFLYVTHGLFSKGTDELLQYFDRIYTTNSFRDIQSNDRVTVYNAWEALQ